MTRILIVEDEILVAMDLQATLEELGLGPVALAQCRQSALREVAASEAAPELALVDVNLADGPTGPEIGAWLAGQFGTSVLFLTANPQSVQTAAAGLGILPKPVERDEIRAATAYASAVRTGRATAPPPRMIPLRAA